MIVRKTAIAALASIAMFVASCGNSNNHNQHDGHDHATETAVSSTETQKANRNENGELIDAAAKLVRMLGREVASISETRALLNIPFKN